MFRTLLYVSLCILCAHNAFSYNSEYLKVTVVTPRIAYDENDDIVVCCVVHNIAKVPVAFTIYDIPYTTFQPVVFRSNGKEAPFTVEYRLRNQTVMEVVRNEVGRTITLFPDEKFVYEARCNNFYNFEKNESYRIKVYFYPDAKDSYAIPSVNEVTIRVHPAPEFQLQTGIIKYERKITPSEIVLLALMAEKNKQWDNVIKYLHIEKVIFAYSDFAKRYATANDYERLIIKQDFINFIKRGRPDYLIDFSIVGEQINTSLQVAYVDVRVKRWGPRFPITMKYRYTLEPYKDYWIIVNIDATLVKD